MTKHAALAVSLILLCVGAGSAAGGRAPAPSKRVAAAIRHEKSLGPKPTPRWFWRWTVWQAGEGYSRGHARQRDLRPKGTPHQIQRWAWRRLHYFLLARRAAAAAPPRRAGGTGIGVLGYGGNLSNVASLNPYSMVIGSSWSADTSLLQRTAGRSLTYFDGIDVAKIFTTGVTYSQA